MIVPIIAGDYRYVKQPEDEKLLNGWLPLIFNNVMLICLLFIAI